MHAPDRDRQGITTADAPSPNSFERLRAEVKADERAEHVDIPVREIDEPQHAEDHRVAERDQRIDRALREPVDELLEKFEKLVGHALSVQVAQRWRITAPPFGRTEIRPSPIVRITAGFDALRCASSVITPVTPL